MGNSKHLTANYKDTQWIIVGTSHSLKGCIFDCAKLDWLFLST